MPGTSNDCFCKPTDVAVSKSGEFFVADGYCNSRIMKFDKDGKFLAKFGEEGNNKTGVELTLKKKWLI